MTKYYMAKHFADETNEIATDCYKINDNDSNYNFVWSTQRWEFVGISAEFPNNPKYCEISIDELYNKIKHQKPNAGLVREIEEIFKKQFYEDVLNE